jgi:cytochrome c
MASKTLLAIVAFTALAGCGQPTAPAPATAPPETTAAAPEPSSIVTPEIAAAVAALPAPYNKADYVNGRRVFNQCRSCHIFEAGAGNRVGPNLHGVFGRKAGSVADFAYSPALKSAGITWDEAQVDHWITNPQQAFPGNRMTFPGLADPDARRDVIAYLKIESSK